MNIPLDDITLRAGSHDTRDEGVCLMEAVAYYAGEPHSDAPACVCPVLGAMGRGLNDCTPDGPERNALIRFVPRVVGTANDGHAETRAYMAADWLIRTYTPTWLDLAGLTEHADALRGLPEVRTEADALAARPVIVAAGVAAGNAARNAARNAAWNAAGNAAWNAAGVAAGVAARNAAGVAAGNAAWNAAWVAAGNAAWNAAWNAARNAARNAAWNAAGNAAGVGAWNAAEDALKPTSEKLRTSAAELYDRMIAVGRTPPEPEPGQLTMEGAGSRP